jgi:hypothetical protein
LGSPEADGKIMGMKYICKESIPMNGRGKSWIKQRKKSNFDGSLGKYFFFFSVLGFELRAYTLSHSTSPFFL